MNYNDNNSEIVTKTEVERITRPYVDKLEKLENIMTNIRGVACSVQECRMITAEIEQQRVQLNYQLDSLLIRAQHDLEKTRIVVPLVCSQLDRIQDRMDKFADKLMEMMDDFSFEAMKKQEMLLDFIEKQNDSFQQLSIRLMR